MGLNFQVYYRPTTIASLKTSNSWKIFLFRDNYNVLSLKSACLWFQDHHDFMEFNKIILRMMKFDILTFLIFLLGGSNSTWPHPTAVWEAEFITLHSAQWPYCAITEYCSGEKFCLVRDKATPYFSHAKLGKEIFSCTQVNIYGVMYAQSNIVRQITYSNKNGRTKYMTKQTTDKQFWFHNHYEAQADNEH
jgi:hypothetical protein